MGSETIVIIGAGLGGLVCAHELIRRGARDVVLLEADAEPGGRVGTLRTEDGYIFDRGFQVLLDSYPAARRQLDLPALAPRYFGSGAILLEGAQRWTLANPLRHPLLGLDPAALGAFAPGDWPRLVALTAAVCSTSDEALLAEADSEPFSTAGYLLGCGFSSAAVERFFRPFFGGVFLDDALATHCGLFRYYLKKFATGRALVPAQGMAAIPRQLAAKLPRGTLRLGCAVREIVTEGNRAVAVHAADGTEFACRAVVVATDERSALRLLGSPVEPTPMVGTTVLYLRAPAPPFPEPMLALPAGRGRLVRHFFPLTQVAPEAAPRGAHVISATVLNRRGLDDAALAAAVKQDLAPWVQGPLECLRVLEVPRALRVQRDARSAAPLRTRYANVLRAGDQTATCSINAALRSGEIAAAELARTL